MTNLRLGSILLSRILFFISVIAAGCTLLSLKKENPGAPVQRPVQLAIPLIYPFLGKNGLYGYADTALNLIIQPQYKQAGLFNVQGYAIVQNQLSEWGVIDPQNLAILPFEYKSIRLFNLDNYTLAEVQKSYQSNARFWEWKFLPGLNLLGGGSTDKRLFDTKVQRLKTTALVLEPKNKKTVVRTVTHRSATTSTYWDHFFKITTLVHDRVVIDAVLYEIRPSRIKKIAGHITDVQNKGSIEKPEDQRFAQQDGCILKILNVKGKVIDQAVFEQVDSLVLTVNGQSVPLRFGRTAHQRLATVYRNTKGAHFMYPDFSKTIPDTIHFASDMDPQMATALLRHPAVICPIPNTPYFLCMGYQDGPDWEPGYCFFDDSGVGYATIDYGGPFKLTLPSGRILWPLKEALFPDIVLPEERVIAKSNHVLAGYYQVWLDGISRDVKAREAAKDSNSISKMGIWDTQGKHWLIAPTYNYLKPLDDTCRFWAFQMQPEGLWGIIDTHHGYKEVVPPKYTYINASGMVTEDRGDKRLNYFIDWISLQEFYAR